MAEEQRGQAQQMAMETGKEMGEQIETALSDMSGMEVKTARGLREALAGLDVRRDQFSALIGIHPVTLSNMLHNRARITDQMILRISAGLATVTKQAEEEGEVAGRRRVDQPESKPEKLPTPRVRRL